MLTGMPGSIGSLMSCQIFPPPCGTCQIQSQLEGDLVGSIFYQFANVEHPNVKSNVELANIESYRRSNQ